jgi:hypothetical protein
MADEEVTQWEDWRDPERPPTTPYNTRKSHLVSSSRGAGRRSSGGGWNVRVAHDARSLQRLQWYHTAVGAKQMQQRRIIIHLLGLAPAGYLTAPNNGA